MRRITRLLFALLLAAFATAGVLAFAPPPLGGHISYVAVRGASMEPHLRSGDLAVVRASAPYVVGDAVAYRSEHLEANVLHRIIDRGPDGFVLQGDNNDFVDPDHPEDGDIIGELWFHVPYAGQIFAGGGPWRTGAVALVVAAAVVLGGVPAAKLTRRQRASGIRLPESRVAMGAVSALAGLAVASAAFAWAAPVLAARQGATPYTHSARIDYQSPVDAPLVYPDGSVDTGEPVFLALVPRVQARFTYRLDSLGAADVNGTATLTALLTNADGLSVELPLTSEPVIDGVAELEATVDVAGLWARAEEFRVATATGGSSATVALLGVVDIRGTLGRAGVDEQFTHEAAFELDRVRMRLPGGQLDEDLTGLSARATGRALVPDVAEPELALAGRALPLLPVRAGTTTAAVAGAALLARLVVRRRRRHGGAPDPLHRYADRIVAAESVITKGTATADLRDAAAIAELADTLDQPILRVRGDYGDMLLVVAPGIVYRHLLPSPEEPYEQDRMAALLSKLDPTIDIRRGEWLNEFALDHLLIAPAGLLAVRGFDPTRIRGTDNLDLDDALQVHAQLASAAARRLHAALVARGAPDVRLVGALIRWDDPAADVATTRHDAILLNGHKATQWGSDLRRPLIDAADREAVGAAVDRHIARAGSSRERSGEGPEERHSSRPPVESSGRPGG